MALTVSVTSTVPNANFLLRHMYGRERLGSLFEYNLSLLTLTPTLEFNDFLGHEVTIKMDLPHEKWRYFHGFITDVADTGYYGRYRCYAVTLRPYLWFLTRTATCRIFHKSTVMDVVKKVLKQRESPEPDDHFLDTSYPTADYLVQYRETDFAFLSRLLEREGIYYFFKHEDGKHTLTFGDKSTARQTLDGYDEVPFYPPDQQRERDHVDTWTPSQNVQPSDFSLNEYDYKQSAGDLNGKLISDVQHPHSAHEVYDYPGSYLEPTADQGSRLVTIRWEEHCRGVVISGAGTARGLGAGSFFKLTERTDADPDGYLVVSASYELHVGDPESSATGGGPAFRCNFEAMSASLTFRPPRSTPTPVVHGPQTAKVVGVRNSPAEILTDDESYGNVKVKFHWAHSDEPENNDSCWMRVSQLWAGDGFGAMHIPRVGQEVIVDFLEGDPDRPIITGRVYNNLNKRPFANQWQSGIKSRSEKASGDLDHNGNELRMDDSKGAEELFVQAERDHVVKVKRNRTLTVGGDESVSVTGKRDTTITKKNTDTYKDEHEMTVTGKVTETFLDEHKLSVTKKQTIKVLAEKEETITGTYKLTTGKEYHLKVEADWVVMESPVGIVLKCGGSLLEVTPSGISLNGMAILAAAGASQLSLDAAGAAITAPMVKLNA